LDKSPFDLSGGEKRRAAIAGVMAMQPRVLVLDEPTAGLDPAGREQLLDRIKKYRDRTGSSVVLVSHSMEDIVKYADKVLVMNHGRLFCYENTDVVFSRAREIRQVGLDIPQITKLSHLLFENGIDLGEDIYTVERAKERLLTILNK